MASKWTEPSPYYRHAACAFDDAICKEIRQAIILARTARRLAQSRAKAAQLRRMSLARDGKWRRRGGKWVSVRKPLFRRVHGAGRRKVNRIPRILAAGEFKCIVDADQWLKNFARLIEPNADFESVQIQRVQARVAGKSLKLIV